MNETTDENVCPICEDKKVTTMIDCYVEIF